MTQCVLFERLLLYFYFFVWSITPVEVIKDQDVVLLNKTFIPSFEALSICSAAELMLPGHEIYSLFSKNIKGELH